MFVALQIVRLVAIVALLCVAAAIATPKDRMPLALRGVAKIFRIATHEQAVPGWKKALALGLVIAAIALALI